MMSRLFEPKTMGDMTISNRIVVSPMCQYMADTGGANSWHAAHLTSMALSGAGLLILEATAVEPEGRITPGCLGLWDDATEEALAASLAVVRKYSPIAIGMQLAHAGRKASCEVPWKGGASIPPDSGGWLPFAPSPVAFKEGDTKPAKLDRGGLGRIKNAFVAAAGRAVRLGLDALELHSAHGYLLHNFLSPLSNLRTDEYGGSLENRMRYPLEVFDAVRKAVPAGVPLGVKISATDWVDGGWDLDQSVIYAKELKKRDVDWITASSGGTSPLQRISLGPGYQVPFASRIKREVDVAVMAVGLITQASQAEKVLADGDADLVALARGLLYDPRWGWHAAAELSATIFAPPPYLRAAPHEHKNLFG